MPTASSDPQSLLRRSLESGRVHSAYLLTGPGSAPRDAALEFVRGLVCQQTIGPCEECVDCRRSSDREAIALDGTGRSGPLLRHIGDHADLFWVERGPDDTRVRIGQIRAPIVRAAGQIDAGPLVLLLDELPETAAWLGVVLAALAADHDVLQRGVHRIAQMRARLL